MCGGDEDHATGVLSLANEEPLLVVKVRINVMQEIVRKDCGNSCDSMVRKGEAPLCRSGCGSVRERAFGAKNGDVGCNWGGHSHRGSEVLTSRGGDEDIIGVDGDILVERGEEESIKDFLSYLGGSGRHH